jgi:hypothetical protein
MELIGRGPTFDHFHLGGDRYRLEVESAIKYALPFDGGDYEPWKLLWSERAVVSSWNWLGKGTQGFLVKPSTGTARVYPVRGDQTKYIQVSGIADQACSVNQTDDRNIEMFVDRAATRWSLKMGPSGLKPEILLKPGWLGTPEWQFRFELYGGLKLEGSWIMDGAERVLKLHDAFVVDAKGNPRAASETIRDGVATITADLSGLTYPIIVDPTLGPDDPSADTRLVSAAPTTNYATSNLALNAWNINNTRTLFRFDLSSIPAGSTVDSTDLQITVYSKSLAGDRAARFHPVTSTWLEAQATWNNRLTGTAWTSAGGDFNAGVVDNVTVTNSLGVKNYVIDNTIQDCIDNSRDDFIFKFTDETDASNRNILFRQSEYGSDEPKLTVNYTAPAGEDVLLGGGLISDNVINGGGFNNFGGFGL